MNKRLPVISNKQKICIICEGAEEYDYIQRLIELNVWNKQYEITLDNADGNGNVSARFQLHYQSDDYDFIFAFVDTDRKPYQQYEDVKAKIDDIFGTDHHLASNEVVIFGNPCTMQIIISHFDAIVLKYANKKKNGDVIEKYTGIQNYKAKKEQREVLFGLINKDNYETMKKNVSVLSTIDTEKGSTNILKLDGYLSSKDSSWIIVLGEKIGY